MGCVMNDYDYYKAGMDVLEDLYNVFVDIEDYVDEGNFSAANVLVDMYGEELEDLFVKPRHTDAVYDLLNSAASWISSVHFSHRGDERLQLEDLGTGIEMLDQGLYTLSIRVL